MKTEGDIAAIRCNLGDRIRVLRTEQDLSQYRFSDMIALDRTYLIGIEKGRRNVSFDNLCKIARGLGVSLSDLFQDVDEGESVARRLRLMEELLRDQQDEQGREAEPADEPQQPDSEASAS